MAYFRVALKNLNGDVVYAGATDAKGANEAIEKERRYAQLPYCTAVAYCGYDDFDDNPVLTKPCHAPVGHFRATV